MKKFFLYVFLTLAILAAIFTYILYTEGAFDTYEPVQKSDMKPFMKCEAGKCGAGKCGTGKPETAEKSDLQPAMKCEAGKCAAGKCGEGQ